MKFLILNGPNLNLLGKREPGIYGTENYEALCRMVEEHASEHGSTADCFQSNHEGAIIDAIQAADGVYDAIVINPGAYTHYSYAIHDALKSVSVPAYEDVYKRQSLAFSSVRLHTVTSAPCAINLSTTAFAAPPAPSTTTRRPSGKISSSASARRKPSPSVLWP